MMNIHVEFGQTVRSVPPSATVGAIMSSSRRKTREIVNKLGEAGSCASRSKYAVRKALKDKWTTSRSNRVPLLQLSFGQCHFADINTGGAAKSVSNFSTMLKIGFKN